MRKKTLSYGVVYCSVFDENTGVGFKTCTGVGFKTRV